MNKTIRAIGAGLLAVIWLGLSVFAWLKTPADQSESERRKLAQKPELKGEAVLDGSFMGAFYVIAFHLFIWTWGIMILARGREDIKLTPKKIFFNYGTVPCAIGLVIFLFKGLIVIPTDSALMPAVKAFGSFFGYLGSLCTPISVLVTGALLATISLPKMFTNAKLYLHSAIKLVAFPVIICLLAKLILSLTPLSPEAINVYVLLATAMAGVPSAATITMLAELYDIEPAYASQSVGMTSILSTATLPLVMLFAQWILTF